MAKYCSFSINMNKNSVIKLEPTAAQKKSHWASFFGHDHE
jgi:hypothetical protein